MGRGTLLQGGTVVDARGERRADVLVEDGRITRVGDVPASDHAVVPARFVTPGLIDCHVHLVADAGPDFAQVAELGDAELGARVAANALRTVRGGVTTVRDLGGCRHAEFGARRILHALGLGPRILLAGQALTITGGHGWFLGREADSPEELVRGAREQVRAGADVLKVIATGGVLTTGADPQAAQYSAEQLAALVRDAARMGRRVAAHAHGAPGIEAAVEAGVASIEHGSYLTDALADRMARQGTHLVPTIAASKSIADAGTERGIPEEHVRKARDKVPRHRESVQRALARGVPIAMGTDAGTPFNDHGDNARELELLVEYGAKPEQALAAATVHAAALLGLPDVGLVEVGMSADLLLLGRNPLDDVGAFRTSLQRVMARGAWA